ncbi:hypothetical protein J7L02_01895 [Candidatus Woesearchaeota archaeon]|nr:hypothetical protein [Candidatus Woesearchaeota archaeon]
MELIKITPDKERAKSILKMTELIGEQEKIVSSFFFNLENSFLENLF